MNEDGERPLTLCQKSKWQWECPRDALFEDYMSPNPTIFNDHQFERIFRITLTVMQEL
jgi:hypothetical protein